MISKKDLAARYNITHNTVTATLKVCGLDTSKRSYTEEEVRERFDIARKLLDGGKKYEDVEQYFATKEVGREEGRGSPNGSPYPSEEGGELKLKEQIASEMGKAVREMVNSAAREIVSYIPAMTAAAFESLVENGDVKDAFADYQERVANLPPSFGESSSAGLLEGEVEYEVVSAPPYSHGEEEAFGEVSEVVGDEDEMASGE